MGAMQWLGITFHACRSWAGGRMRARCLRSIGRRHIGRVRLGSSVILARCGGITDGYLLLQVWGTVGA